MKTLRNSATVAALGLLCLGAAGCDTKGTTEVKREAKAIDKSYEAQADVVDAAAKGTPDENAAHQQADALRNQGETIKDNLIDEAKETQKATH